MEHMRKIAIIAIIIAAGALAYFGVQRYQNHHAHENVKIQGGTAVYNTATGVTSFLSSNNGVTPLAHTATPTN